MSESQWFYTQELIHAQTDFVALNLNAFRAISKFSRQKFIQAIS